MTTTSSQQLISALPAKNPARDRDGRRLEAPTRLGPGPHWTLPGRKSSDGAGDRRDVSKYRFRLIESGAETPGGSASTPTASVKPRYPHDTLAPVPARQSAMG